MVQYNVVHMFRHCIIQIDANLIQSVSVKLHVIAEVQSNLQRTSRFDAFGRVDFINQHCFVRSGRSHLRF